MSSELVQLRSFYSAPSSLVLAFDDTTPVGVVGLLIRPESTGEIRRLYVGADSRTSGLGRRLVDCVLERARTLGLSRLVLSTLPTMLHAQALYRSLGFTECMPYVEDSTAGVLYFQLQLS